MSFLTNPDRKRILAALKNAEAQTSGELVCVIAPAADTYLFAPTLVAACLALLLPGLLWLTGITHEFAMLYAIQLVAFVGLAAILHFSPLGLWTVPRKIQTQRARRLAREQFFLNNLHVTAGRTGVLLFVSAAEHHVEIIADTGIDAAVPAGTWDAIIAAFTLKVRAGQTADGFVVAIEAMAAILAKHAPRQRDDRNELPDRLVELQ